ncbi:MULTISPECIES: AAA family ATPase [Vibrio]|uniref:AAA family ATPase n=1 Tax=Vibrio TaxID=662 RepID=UPI000309EA4C|nr:MULTISPECIES: AAA family ATPase [Vibrio]OEE91447.1 hypothetical protein A140_14085 [Vibrio crassostreae 9ZC88]PMG54045.1 hypothetical protein BCU89_16495 [Vibrio splendidus]
MSGSKGLLLKKLVLVGHRKNYRVPFYPGVNIIYGDADTGKSSILRIIYYMLGGKQVKLDEEICSSVKYAVLDLEINNSPYCIIRDLYNASKEVEVYGCNYESINEHYPDKYFSSVNQGTEEKKSLSSFIIDELNFPNVNIKQSPSKDISATARLSILDLFKYMYLNQDDVGSTHMLNIGNFVLETKNKEVLKYIFNILDSNISDLESEISEKSRAKSELIQQIKIVSNFLSSVKFEESVDIDDELTRLDDLKATLSLELKSIDNKTTSNSELYSALKEALQTIILKIKELEFNKIGVERNIERFTRLHNDYKNDAEKIKSATSAKEIIGRDAKKSTCCPICENVILTNELSKHFEVSDDIKLNHELNSITRRCRELVELIHENRVELEKNSKILEELYKEKKHAQEYIDEELSNSISPYLAERDFLVKEIAKIEEQRDNLLESLKIRNKQNHIIDKISKIEGNIIDLKLRLEEMKEKAPSTLDMLGTLSNHFDSFLSDVKINNQSGVKIDERTFLPVVRNTEYRNINSGGMRTIASIGYLYAILKARLSFDTNLPNLMMIDTVGKFLGKTPENLTSQTDIEADLAEGVSDPDKYKNIYKALIELAKEFSDKDKLCQIILVDNDLPPEISSEYSSLLVAHYRSNGINSLPRGLIDDWVSVKS